MFIFLFYDYSWYYDCYDFVKYTLNFTNLYYDVATLSIQPANYTNNKHRLKCGAQPN